LSDKFLFALLRFFLRSSLHLCHDYTRMKCALYIRNVHAEVAVWQSFLFYKFLSNTCVSDRTNEKTTPAVILSVHQRFPMAQNSREDVAFRSVLERSIGAGVTSIQPPMGRLRNFDDGFTVSRWDSLSARQLFSLDGSIDRRITPGGDYFNSPVIRL